MDLVLPTYNAHPYLFLKNLCKNCTLYMAKYSKFVTTLCSQFLPFYISDYYYTRHMIEEKGLQNEISNIVY